MRSTPHMPAVVSVLALLALSCSDSSTDPTDDDGLQPAPTVQLTQTDSLALVANVDDYLYAWLDGEQVLDSVRDSRGSGYYASVSLDPGRHVIGAQLFNRFMCGYFGMYLGREVVTYVRDSSGAVVDTLVDLPDQGVLVTDTAWRYHYAPGDNWLDPGLDMSDWRPAHSLGTVGDAYSAPGTAGFDTTTGAHYLYGQPDVYYRGSFTAADAGSGVMKFGGNDLYDLYFNGTLLHEHRDSTFANTFICTVSVTAGVNVIAAHAVDTAHGFGGNVLCELILDNGDTIVSNSSWLFNDVYTDAWETVGFDDSRWFAAGDHGDYLVDREWCCGPWINDPAFIGAWSVSETTQVLDTVSMYDWTTGASYDTVVVKDSIQTTATGARWIFRPENVYFRYEFEVVEP